MTEQKRIHILEQRCQRSVYESHGSQYRGLVPSIRLMAIDGKDTIGKCEQYFTPEERLYCGERISSYTARFTAKNAIMDILEQDVPWQDISIGSAPSGKPFVTLRGKAEIARLERGIGSLSLSLSHDAGIAVAFVAGQHQEGSDLPIGVDIGSTQRIKQLYNKHGDRFLRRRYSVDEIDYKDVEVEDLALRWAGKEAIIKVLGADTWRRSVEWNQIGIVERENDYTVNLAGTARFEAERRSIAEVSLGIVKDNDNPIAYAIGK